MQFWSIDRRSLAVAAFAAATGFALTIATAADAREAPTATRTPGGPFYTPPPAQNISGIWWVRRYDPKIVPVGGGELPFTPAGLQKYRENMAGLKSGALKDEARRICVPDGIPRLSGNPYPFQIIQTPGQVTITYEVNHIIRPLYLNGPPPSADDVELFPRYIGYSTAKWEGNVLVVESVGFHQDIFIDATGVPHSEQLKTVERFRKVDDKTLETEVTVTDPAMFTRPWQARFVYDLHPEERLRDYNCGESFRDISRVPGVAEARRARTQP